MHVQTLVQMLYNYKMSGTSLFYILVQICHICLEKSKANPLKIKDWGKMTDVGYALMKTTPYQNIGLSKTTDVGYASMTTTNSLWFVNLKNCISHDNN